MTIAAQPLPWHCQLCEKHAHHLACFFAESVCSSPVLSTMYLLCLQSAEKGKKAKSKGRKRKASGKDEYDFEEESTPEPAWAAAEEASNGDSHKPSTPTPGTAPSDITSSNAYMLLYKKRDWQPQGAQPSPALTLPDRCVSCYCSHGDTLQLHDSVKVSHTFLVAAILTILQLHDCA